MLVDLHPSIYVRGAFELIPAAIRCVSFIRRVLLLRLASEHSPACFVAVIYIGIKKEIVDS